MLSILQYFWTTLSENSGLENHHFTQVLLYVFPSFQSLWLDIFLNLSSQKKKTTSIFIILLRFQRNFHCCYSPALEFWGQNIVYSLHAGYFFIIFYCLQIYFKINIFKNFFQEYHQSVKQYGFRLGLTFGQAWSVPKLFAKVIRGQQKLLPARKVLTTAVFGTLQGICTSLRQIFDSKS